MPWHATQTKPAQGHRAAQHLQNQHIHCFYPKVWVERVRAGKRTQRLKPLLPGYLFINIAPEDPQR